MHALGDHSLHRQQGAESVTLNANLTFPCNHLKKSDHLDVAPFVSEIINVGKEDIDRVTDIFCQ